jgi:hypothetical protein
VSTACPPFKENCQYISPLNLDGTASLLGELGHDAEADDVVEVYVEQHSHKPDLFDLERYPFSENIRDERLKESRHKKIPTLWLTEATGAG